ncbi:hypothetical protein SAMN05421788_103190 [Filimonas lacunae]|uniref:Lipoprotein n=1 Tax=Filimonas lacunae TaxID=477680 RepID=A0A173MJN8_9BACT|nr:hypothetical protein [Filimonas lacunae]BAV07845.1 hypothetical protein FLA_3876 [Filimonas lacunae]SIT05541.1 hypothetical protein SAMN05421788_103190 [Filimonas lacunae]
MKSLKSLALIALSVFTFAACSKKDDAPANSGSFTYDSKSYGLTNGYFLNWGTDGGELELISASYETLISNPTGTYNAIDVDFVDSTIQVGTFTYKYKYDETFDKTKNFTSGTAYINVSANGSSGGVNFVEGSTVIVTKNGDGYSVSIDAKLEDGKTLTGTYSGSVGVLND